MTYTTQELINILDRELHANWKGKRVVLSSAKRINDPVVAKLLNMERVSKVFAYQDFRHQIHEYQKQYLVSGIIWRNCTFQGKTICYPEIDNQLIPIDGDKEILIAEKKLVIDFWQEVTADMNFWLANAPGREREPNSTIVEQDHCSLHHKISREYMNKLIRQAEWAEIDAAQTELYLGLCWGNPAEYRYQWAKPKSGCDRIIATKNQPSTIKI